MRVFDRWAAHAKRLYQKINDNTRHVEQHERLAAEASRLESRYAPATPPIIRNGASRRNSPQSIFFLPYMPDARGSAGEDLHQVHARPGSGGRHPEDADQHSFGR